jgi:tRNA (guanine37-N1)-methyltransferase
VDERVARHLADLEISIGDYVLSGGEPAAVVVVDAAARFVPGVVGKEDSVRHDSFAEGILDFPHYTRPREFRGLKVPAVLFSGDHRKIERWRRKKALEKTLDRRPDLLEDKDLTREDRNLLEEIRNERKAS